MFCSKLTRRLLLLVASDGTRNSVELPLDAVGDTLNIALGLSSGDLGLALSVLLFAALGPGGSASRVSDGLDDGALNRVIPRNVIVSV
jgi:hypothetical protein